MLNSSEKIKINALTRSKRRSVLLEIKANGDLSVRAPLSFAYSSILEIVNKKAQWIEEKQQQIKSRELVNNNEKYFLGKKYAVVYTYGDTESISLSESSFLLTLCQFRTVEALLSRWYKRKTLEIVFSRAAKLADEFGLKITKLSISNAKRRWGSCNVNGHITFSFRLVMMPLEIVDYIIVHELAHLLELNHSKNFWAVVCKMMPDYEERESWLKQNGYRFYL